MSALAVLLTLDGRPVPAEQLQRLLTLQHSSGPDSQLSLTSGPIGLGVAVLATTPEDHLDPPCFRDPRSGISVVFEGYLSNRADLASALALSTSELNVCGDARLVAYAYERWQLDTWTHLDGEFCVALWDPAVQQLVIARDAFGCRPMYYRRSSTQVTAASEIQALVRAEASPINEGVVGETLLARPSTIDETLFQDIKRLPPAHALIAQADGRWRLDHYWRLDLTTTVQLASDGEYAEAFAEQLSRAVRATLRTDRPVSVMLSGGMDSSAIVAEATAARTRGVHPLRAFTIGFPDRPVDESAWAAAVAAHTGTPWRAVWRSSHSYDYRGDADATLQLPAFPSGANAAALRAAVVEAGGRVLLNGYGGDEWFFGSDWCYADLLRQGRLLEWLRQVRADVPLGGVTPTGLIRNSVFPMIPPPWWRRVRRLARPVTAFGILDVPFCERISLEERLIDRALPSAGSYARRDIGREALSPISIDAKEQLARLGARSGTADRHPYFNRQLVNFAVALPDAQRRSDGIPKRVMRLAYRSALPPSVTARVERFDFSFLVTDAIRRLVNNGLFEPAHVVERGWVNEQPLRELIAAAIRDPESGRGADAAMQLWPVVAVEVWLTSVLG
ncbi:MAG TPA: asparagine synthase-related protein [Vicinamibacterales bacterium]|nr:asparagine synthase-related protein [Vicinamibacterales bacterium]